MKTKLLFKNEEGFVKTTSPLSFTKDLKEAWNVDFDTSNSDESELLKLADPLREISLNANSLEWDIVWTTEDLSDLVAVATIKMPAVSLNINHKCSKETSSEIKRVIEDLQGYVIDIHLELSDIDTETPDKKEPESLVSKLAAALKGADTSSEEEEDIDKLINHINNKTKATVVKPKETLDDYVCDDLLKEELTEIVDFFKNAEEYKKCNVTIPIGILFKGLPGTGKTYAARCIAGTTDAYFLTCTASSLQGMYIGSGAENIRNLFNAAKALKDTSNKGVIIFIDEIDSLGSRESHSNSSSGEEDRTLNQLLAEMSGFEETEGIMILAATNYPERLDDALMRSGRFSRQINIEYPDDKERFHLVEHYFSKIKMPLESWVTYDTIAELAEGLSPADIKDISNEAAIMSIRYKKTEISLDNINEAINKVITKNIRKPDSPKTDYTLIAAHECGHVLAEYIYEHTVPIKVTSYSYGDAGGFTQSKSKLEGILPKESFTNRVKVLLAGRAAEEVLCHTITNGASNDLYKAKKIMRSYYEYYHFEEYEVEKLEQIILDTIDVLYNEVVEDFNKEDNFKNLSILAETLCSERILYTADIKAIISKEDIL